MKRLTGLFLVLVFSLCFSQTASAEVTAEWTPESGSTKTNFCGGVSVCGRTVTEGFHVISGSGYINIVGTPDDGLTTTNGAGATRMWVEEGIDYKVELSVDRMNNFQTVASSSSTCFEVTFDSPVFLNPVTRHVPPFSTAQGQLRCLSVVKVSEEVDEFQLNASDGAFADHVRVTWNEIADTSSYRVFRCTDTENNSCGSLIGFTADNGFNDTDGVAGTHYYYRVKACTPEGCGSFSDYDEGHRVVADDHGDSCAEATPVDVNSTTPSEFETFWDQDYFRIILPTAGSLTVYSLGAADTNGILKDASCSDIASNYRDGENWNFRITRELDAGTYYVEVSNLYTSYKGPYEFVSSFGDTPALVSPTGVNATDGTFTDRVRISWNSATGATKYEVYRCTNNMDSSCGSSLGSPGGTSFDDMGGAAETTYWYRVKACTADMCSSFSEADSGYRSASVPNEGCDEAYVQQDNNALVLNVAPTGIDDTANIQCALDTAVDTGIPTVRLDSGTYYISKLMVENFKGSFEGKTKTTTILEVVDGSINCEAMNDSGLDAAAIKFVKGEPRIRFMTIRAQLPCISGSIDSILHFTGESAQIANCDNDVIFAVVDRIIVEGPGLDNGLVVAIAVWPEGKWLGGCKDTLLGTFKLNRSTISNTAFGVLTSMKSGAQVDINFNEFRGNLQAVSLYDTNQNTTITTNRFFGDNTAEYSFYGVIVTNFSDDPPPSTRMVVHNNEFNVSSSFSEKWSNAIYVSFNNGVKVISNVSSVITNNKFNLSDDSTYAVSFTDTSNTHVASNWFNGSGARAIFIGGNAPVSGWTISANMGLADFTSAREGDIRFNSNTSNCIVGPGQGATVEDFGTNNTILPQ